MVEIKQKTYNTDKGKERIILVTQEPNAIPVAWLALNEQCRSKEKKLLFFSLRSCNECFEVLLFTDKVNISN